MSIMTFSKQLGSLGSEIARSLAEKLNYEYVDKERIAKVLAAQGLPPAEVERFDEKKPPFWDSLQIQRKRFLHLIQAMIYDFARKDNAIIVGRGGQVLLKDLPGVLRVRIVAPFDIRVRRIKELEMEDEKRAAAILRRSDRDSAGFLRSFFDVDWDDPNLYDLVISTEKLSLDTAVKMILESIRSPEIREKEKGTEEKLADLALLQKVEASLLGILESDIAHIKIRIERGIVTLSGEIPSAKYGEHCQTAVAKVEGVKQVDNQLVASTPYKYGT
jgi:cytidylate kinase